MAISFKGAHLQAIILTGVRWYVAYPLSTRHVEELMLERGVHVDHSTINRGWSSIAHNWRRRSTGASAPCGSIGGWTKPISKSKGNGTTSIALWISRARPLTFCSRSTGTKRRRCSFSRKRSAGTVCQRITIDGSAANEAAIKRYNGNTSTAITIRKRKYLNHSWSRIIEQ